MNTNFAFRFRILDNSEMATFTNENIKFYLYNAKFLKFKKKQQLILNSVDRNYYKKQEQFHYKFLLMLYLTLKNPTPKPHLITRATALEKDWGE